MRTRNLINAIALGLSLLALAAGITVYAQAGTTDHNPPATLITTEPTDLENLTCTVGGTVIIGDAEECEHTLLGPAGEPLGPTIGSGPTGPTVGSGPTGPTVGPYDGNSFPTS